MESYPILRAIDRLIQYGIVTKLIDEDESIYSTNLLLDQLHIDYYDGKWFVDESLSDEMERDPKTILHNTLEELVSYAVQNQIIEDIGPYREIFSTKLMNCITPRPKEVIAKFWKDYTISPETATANFFEFSKDTNYINRYRLASDMHWTTETPYGDLQILISLSKPELDPKAIALARKKPSVGYPKCALCKENEGYAGRIDFAARQTHRIIPFTLGEEKFNFQFSPYRYCNQHCIVLNDVHTPMVIDASTVMKLLLFLKLFPHFFIGSNSDLPYVGGSVLSHEHFQGGVHRFPLMDAKVETIVKKTESLEIATLFWPLSTLRIKGKDIDEIEREAGKFITGWKVYSDEGQQIDAGTKDDPHNTMTPLAYKENDDFVLFLMLRNNKTTKERPEGIFHTRPAYYHIKKEGIGIIDAPGLAIFPPRLKRELLEIKECLLSHQRYEDHPDLQAHWEWMRQLESKYHTFQEETISEILKKEVGLLFMKMLEDCGVFKQTEAGQQAFQRFIKKCMTI